jgi:cob(I)alamin adenosyltransferase
MRKGYIQVYTGDGKGKTTAALGLALRAAGAGLRVLVAQFIKKRKCSEHKALERFSDLITVRQYGRGFIMKRQPTKADRELSLKGLQEIAEALSSKMYDVVILDEANVAVHYDLFSADDLLAVITARPKNMEVIITGRYASEKIIAVADLVTEMKSVKHYKEQGIKARLGIEY